MTWNVTGKHHKRQLHINQMLVKAPEISWFARQVSCTFDKRCEWRYTVADEVIGLYQNRPVYYWQPRISMVDFHLSPTTRAAA